MRLARRADMPIRRSLFPERRCTSFLAEHVALRPYGIVEVTAASKENLNKGNKGNLG